MKNGYSLPDITITLFGDVNITTTSSVVDGVNLAETVLNEKNISNIKKKSLDSLQFAY